MHWTRRRECTPFALEGLTYNDYGSPYNQPPEQDEYETVMADLKVRTELGT